MRFSPRHVLCLAVVVSMTSLAPAQTIRSTGKSQTAAPQRVEAQVVRHIRAMEQHLKQAERQLQQQMARAKRLRQNALAKNSRRGLQEAERLEKAAIKHYEQQINRFKQTSHQLGTRTRSAAKAAASRANASSKSGPKRSSSRSRSRSRRFRWLPFGR